MLATPRTITLMIYHFSYKLCWDQWIISQTFHLRNGSQIKHFLLFSKYLDDRWISERMSSFGMWFYHHNSLLHCWRWFLSWVWMYVRSCTSRNSSINSSFFLHFIWKYISYEKREQSKSSSVPSYNLIKFFTHFFLKATRLISPLPEILAKK